MRYLIQTGRLPASKIADRWFVDDADLPRSSAQEKASERKQRGLRVAVEKALDLAPPSSELRPRRNSVRDLKAFQVALPLHRHAPTSFGEDHSATRALRHVLAHLACGCHRFDQLEKADTYREARRGERRGLRARARRTGAGSRADRGVALVGATAAAESEEAARALDGGPRRLPWLPRVAVWPGAEREDPGRLRRRLRVAAEKGPAALERTLAAYRGLLTF